MNNLKNIKTFLVAGAAFAFALISMIVAAEAQIGVMSIAQPMISVYPADHEQNYMPPAQQVPSQQGMYQDNDADYHPVYGYIYNPEAGAWEYGYIKSRDLQRLYQRQGAIAQQQNRLRQAPQYIQQPQRQAQPKKDPGRYEYPLFFDE